MLKELKTRLADESGVMPIIEATFVFPIMFFVIFFLFFMGNMYVSKSYTDNLVSEAAIRYAAQCADPNLTLINHDNKLPDTGLKNEPYRYLFNAFGSSGSIEDAVSACKTYIKDGGSSFLSFFKGMEPLDFYRYPPNSERERIEREELRKIKEKLDAAGIKTRPIFWNESDRARYYREQGAPGRCESPDCKNCPFPPCEKGGRRL